MTDDWSDYERLVVYRLDQLDEKVNALADEQGKLRSDVVQLRTYSSLWGAAAGLFTAVGTALLGRKH